MHEFLMHVLQQLGYLFLACKEVEHHVFLDNLQEIDYHVVLLEIGISIIFLEEYLQIC